jgi:uncharacterized protein (TIGR02246 family)
MTNATPPVIDRFVQAEQDADFDALASCFGPDGVVLDEGRTHLGRTDIAAWRRAAAEGPAFTAVVTGQERLGPGGYKVVQHLEGDFPGGVADLDYLFALKDGTIAALMIFQQKG